MTNLIDVHTVAYYCFRLSSSLSFICSCLTFFIIIKLNKPINIFRIIIIGLTFFQAIYDLILILQDFIPAVVFVFFNYLGWTAATLFSNIMSSLLLLYIYIYQINQFQLKVTIYIIVQ